MLCKTGGTGKGNHQRTNKLKQGEKNMKKETRIELLQALEQMKKLIGMGIWKYTTSGYKEEEYNLQWCRNVDVLQLCKGDKVLSEDVEHYLTSCFETAEHNTIDVSKSMIVDTSIPEEEMREIEKNRKQIFIDKWISKDEQEYHRHYMTEGAEDFLLSLAEDRAEIFGKEYDEC